MCVCLRARGDGDGDSDCGNVNASDARVRSNPLSTSSSMARPINQILAAMRYSVDVCLCMCVRACVWYEWFHFARVVYSCCCSLVSLKYIPYFHVIVEVTAMETMCEFSGNWRIPHQTQFSLFRNRSTASNTGSLSLSLSHFCCCCCCCLLLAAAAAP